MNDKSKRKVNIVNVEVEKGIVDNEVMNIPNAIAEIKRPSKKHGNEYDRNSSSFSLVDRKALEDKLWEKDVECRRAKIDMMVFIRKADRRFDEELKFRREAKAEKDQLLHEINELRQSVQVNKILCSRLETRLHSVLNSTDTLTSIEGYIYKYICIYIYKCMNYVYY